MFWFRSPVDPSVFLLSRRKNSKKFYDAWHRQGYVPASFLQPLPAEAVTVAAAAAAGTAVAAAAGSDGRKEEGTNPRLV